jgi:Tfp pilus assembly protein PilF
MRVTAGHFKAIRMRKQFCLAGLSLWVATAALGYAQEQPRPTADLGIIRGHVQGPNGAPLGSVIVSLETPDGANRALKPAQTTQTHETGTYQFSGLHSGTYKLAAALEGYGGVDSGSIILSQDETRTVDLALGNPKTSENKASPPAASNKVLRDTEAPEFYDEPQFTVAGVTQATNSGGHGSDTVARTTEALAKATVSLGEKSDDKLRGAAEVAANTATAAAMAQSLRDQIAREPENADAHHSLGEIEEKLGHPLEAAREYQRAAGIQPSERNVFDWGTELLTHRALEPATEVFRRGNHLYPKSVRMLIGLGVAWYARGSSEQAAQSFCAASDLDPANPTPYLFLGKMQSAELVTPEDSAERLRRFVQLQPENALANYYYAVSLWKQSAARDASDTDHDPAQEGNGSGQAAGSAQAQTLLQKAVRVDPKLGPAYLQLGILYSQQGDFSKAIPEYQKAIELSPEFDPTLAQTHYRLAQAYLRTGDRAKAKEELELRRQADQQAKQETQTEHREMQEFVISLGKQNSEQPSKP